MPPYRSLLRPGDAPPQGRFVFELWKLNLVGGAGAHAFLVVHDTQTNKYLTFQGLATNRQTGNVQPIGNPITDDIKVWVDGSNPRDINAAEHKDDYQKVSTLYATNDPLDAGYRITRILAAASGINDGNHPYDLRGKIDFIWQTAYNSNSVATTLLAAGARCLQGQILARLRQVGVITSRLIQATFGTP